MDLAILDREYADGLVPLSLLIHSCHLRGLEDVPFRDLSDETSPFLLLNLADKLHSGTPP